MLRYWHRDLVLQRDGGPVVREVLRSRPMARASSICSAISISGEDRVSALAALSRDSWGEPVTLRIHPFAGIERPGAGLKGHFPETQALIAKEGPHHAIRHARVVGQPGGQVFH